MQFGELNFLDSELLWLSLNLAQKLPQNLSCWYVERWGKVGLGKVHLKCGESKEQSMHREIPMHNACVVCVLSACNAECIVD